MLRRFLRWLWPAVSFVARVRRRYPDALVIPEDCQDTYAIVRIGRTLIAVDRDRLLKDGGARTAACLIRDLKDISHG